MRPLDPASSRFIERFGLLFENEGVPRIAGRLTALLLVVESEFSLDEIAEILGVSKASVSTDARRMETKGFLVRTSHPGDRRDYYAIAPDGFRTMLDARIDALEHTLSLCEEARRLPAKSAVVRNRLDEWTDFTSSMIESLSTLLAAWDRRRPTRLPSRPRSLR
jgi:DNA-binding transcriptional regulator GbsR (MarR family)